MKEIAFSLVLLSVSLSMACEPEPMCDQLVAKFCAAAGEPGCSRLKERPPTDQATCEGTLADPVEFKAQLDTLKASAAAIPRRPKPKAPPPKPKE
jgi:hypothetical protein